VKGRALSTGNLHADYMASKAILDQGTMARKWGPMRKEEVPSFIRRMSIEIESEKEWLWRANKVWLNGDGEEEEDDEDILLPPPSTPYPFSLSLPFSHFFSDASTRTTTASRPHSIPPPRRSPSPESEGSDEMNISENSDGS